MTKTPAEEVDEILAEAFDKAKAVLDRQVETLFATRPGRYERFVMAVGWGNMLYGHDGKVVHPEDMDETEMAVVALAEKVSESLGADNSQVMASDVAPAPPIAFLDASSDAEPVEVFVTGRCDDPFEGRPGDLQVRPVALGVGPYTMTVQAADVHDADGRPFVHVPAARPSAPSASRT